MPASSNLQIKTGHSSEILVSIYEITPKGCLFQWPPSLGRVSMTIRLLRLRVRISPGAWISFPCKCCVLTGRGLCDGPINRPGEFHRA